MEQPRPFIHSLTRERSLPHLIKKFLAFVIGGIFGAAAIAIFWILLGMFAHHHAARSWVAVPATINDVQIINSRSSGISPSRSTINSKLKAAYRYTFKGIDYTSTQVDFSFGSDNFAVARRSRQMELLRSAAPTVFVNPANPVQSVLDRSLPIEQVNFAVVFLFFPCGLGTIMMLGWSFALAAKLGLVWPSRFLFPIFGLIHTLPAFYAPLFAVAGIGLFGWLLVMIASVVLLISLRAFWRRLKDPTIDAPHMVTRSQRGFMKREPHTKAGKCGPA
jgi:hypothetical protein